MVEGRIGFVPYFSAKGFEAFELFCCLAVLAFGPGLMAADGAADLVQGQAEAGFQARGAEQDVPGQGHAFEGE